MGSELRNDRVGETAMSACGQTMTIIKYANNRNISIQFEDGTILYGRSYAHFKNGLIKHPNGQALKKIGQTKAMNCGLTATCTAYRNSKDADFRFSDGTIIEHQAWTGFTRKSLHPPGEKCYNREEWLNKQKERAEKSIQAYVGKSVKCKNGHTATCTGYQGKTLTIQWETGEIQENIDRNQFRNGCIQKGEKSTAMTLFEQKQTGRIIKPNSGMSLKILECERQKRPEDTNRDGWIHVKAEFEDGSRVEETVSMPYYQRSGIKHPLYPSCKRQYKNDAMIGCIQRKPRQGVSAF